MTADTTRPARAVADPPTAPETTAGPPPVAQRPATTTSRPAARAGRDPRVQALLRFAISISAFCILGYTLFGFEQAPITPFACLLASYASALGLEAVDAWAHRRRPVFLGGWRPLGIFLLPPHITALSCTILLYANADLWPYVFAVVVGNASKYLVRLRIRGRLQHILNPSNTGIAVTLVLFPWVGIGPPYHFTNWLHGTLSWLVPLGILTAGTMLNAQLTRKMPLIAGWVGGFLVQALLRWLLLDQVLLGMLLPLTGVAFILYTNYMITDPGSTPFRPRSQLVFGLTTGLVYGALVVSGVVFGLFFALVITCLLRGAVILLGRLRTTAPAGARPIPGTAR